MYCLQLFSTDCCIDLFARDAKKPSVVDVRAKAYRRVALYEPGGMEYPPISLDTS
jgi:hypothetical protein